MPKCLIKFAPHQNPPEFTTVCVYQHFSSIDPSFSTFNAMHVEFGNDLEGVLLTIYLQSSCSSPFLGKYVGTVTPKDVWMSIFLRGKEVIIDGQGKETRYPEKLPALFRSAPVEDYRKDVCIYLCQNRISVSWDSHRDYNSSHCEIPDENADDNSNHVEMCSADDCHDETAFASIDYFVEHLPIYKTNLDKTQLPRAGVMGNNSQVWVKSDCNFFTVKRINIEKKFEEFLAEIGGNFGLLAGASVLTLVEIGEFIVKIVKKIIFNWKKVELRNSTF